MDRYNVGAAVEYKIFTSGIFDATYFLCFDTGCVDVSNVIPIVGLLY